MTTPEPSFPRLVCCTKIDPQHSDVAGRDFYDVKFWPYPLDDDEQIFAVAGTTEVFVCRTVTKAEPPFEILYWWHDSHTGASINSIAWMQDVPSGKPLLCLAGSSPRHIAMIDISSGKEIRALTGHGRNINELVVSPTHSNILASCSEDFTIRLWNIDPALAAQPCVALLGGEGHRQPLLACAFHPNGKWILSGAMDTAVALWAVPPPNVLAREGIDSDEPVVVTYPHFYSIEVHPNYVDSLAFYGDLIISRCAQQQNKASKQHEILLWKINGFQADAEPPEDIAVPRPGRESRSSFQHDPLTQGFQRLLSFSMPNTDRFYLRFGLFNVPGLRPMLCMGSVLSKFSFWDLQKLEEPYTTDSNPTLPVFVAPMKGVAKKTGRKRRADGEEIRHSLLSHVERENSVMSNASRDTGTSTPTRLSQKEVRSVLDDPLQLIKPHHVVTADTDVTKKYFATYTTAWSQDGRWVISVGDQATMVMMYREKVT